METVQPKVFLVASTVMDDGGLQDYLDHVGAPDWVSDGHSDVEQLPEVLGRLCYRSWRPGLNPNVTKVREGNEAYLANILNSGHGSVLEHSSATFIFADVSRVFTHELVRHRVGVAISQESLRYVRLEHLKFYMPECIQREPEALAEFHEAVKALESLQMRLANLFDLDNPKLPFSVKKEITSAMRRVAPIGLATTIGWTANMRTLRHVLEQRTSPHAEEEIRVVFRKVGVIAQQRWPNIFQDMTMTDNGQWVFGKSKI